MHAEDFWVPIVPTIVGSGVIALLSLAGVSIRQNMLEESRRARERSAELVKTAVEERELSGLGARRKRLANTNWLAIAVVPEWSRPNILSTKLKSPDFHDAFVEMFLGYLYECDASLRRTLREESSSPVGSFPDRLLTSSWRASREPSILGDWFSTLYTDGALVVHGAFSRTPVSTSDGWRTPWHARELLERAWRFSAAILTQVRPRADTFLTEQVMSLERAQLSLSIDAHPGTRFETHSTTTPLRRTILLRAPPDDEVKSLLDGTVRLSGVVPNR